MGVPVVFNDLLIQLYDDMCIVSVMILMLLTFKAGIQRVVDKLLSHYWSILVTILIKRQELILQLIDFYVTVSKPNFILLLVFSYLILFYFRLLQPADQLVHVAKSLLAYFGFVLLLSQN